MDWDKWDYKQVQKNATSLLNEGKQLTIDWLTDDNLTYDKILLDSDHVTIGFIHFTPLEELKVISYPTWSDVVNYCNENHDGLHIIIEAIEIDKKCNCIYISAGS